MTRKTNLKSIKSKLIIFLTVLCLAFSFLGLYACDDTDKDVKDPNYSIDKESSDVLIKNANFFVETANKELSSFPLTNINGWSRASTDNSSSASSVSSGVVNVTDNGWKNLLDNLYKDNDFVSYFKNLYDFTSDDVKESIKTAKNDPDYTPTSDEIKEYVINNYVNVKTATADFTNPSKSPEATDNYVYMLNNIAVNANYGLGTAQKITSSSTVNMKKDKIYELSVWVKTANVNNQINSNVGANIRLTNSINKSTQAQYQISNIVCDDWTKYTIYIQSDSDYSCTFTLVLGLGYGGENSNDCFNYAEGTVYFDDITIKEVENFNESITPDYMVFNEEQPLQASLTSKNDLSNNAHKVCLYSMDFTHSEQSYLNDLSPDVYTSDFTTSNVTVDDGSGNQVPLTSRVKVGASSTQELVKNGTEATVNVNTASATVTLKDSSFSLNNGQYGLLSFYVKNELEAPADTNVYVDLFDVYGAQSLKVPATITISEPNDDFVRYVVLVKNNFTTGSARTFYFNFVVGPNDVASVVYDSDFSTGSVTIKDITFVKGNLEDENELFDFFSSVANSTVALHAGFENDFNEESSNENYSFSTKPGNVGDIIFNPTNPKDFTGIVANHAYISNADGAETATDTRSSTGKDYDVDGIAGLINTKYVNNYTDKNGANYGYEILNKLGFKNGDDNIQPIMIKNNVSGHYGYVGKKITINPSSNATVTANIKVCDDAKAYVYLVDVSGTEKNVLTFNDFTVNTDVVKDVPINTQVQGSDLKYQLEITSDMMSDNGWLTVSFYVGTGNTEKSFRLEIWNGGRDGSAQTASQGYVFIKSQATAVSAGFTEAQSWTEAFTTKDTVLYNQHKASLTKPYAYHRQLNGTEINFNNDYPEQAISYSPNYVWAQNENMVYGVFNTIDPAVYNPYDAIEEEEEVNTGCTATTDPATFWLSFSSIVLAAILLLALVALIVKRYRAKAIANKNDALSHYKVTSRIRSTKNISKTKAVKEEVTEKEIEAEQPADEEVAEKTTEEKTEEATDEYVYGEVQSFGEEQSDSSNKDE